MGQNSSADWVRWKLVSMWPGPKIVTVFFFSLGRYLLGTWLGFVIIDLRSRSSAKSIDSGSRSKESAIRWKLVSMWPGPKIVTVFFFSLGRYLLGTWLGFVIIDLRSRSSAKSIDSGSRSKESA